MNYNYSNIPSVLFILLTITVTGLAQTAGNPDTILPGPRAQIETPIAINPTDPNNLIGAAITQPEPAEENRIGYYYSFDRGATWNGNDDINGPGLGDPVVAFDPDGVGYILYQKQSDSGLYLHKSSDGAASWSGPITVVLFNPNEHKVDRPWLAISPERNIATGYYDIYVSYSQFEEPTYTDDTHIRVYKSSDGAQTFSQWYSWNGTQSTGALGSFVATGPGEKVFISFAKFEEGPKESQPATSILVTGSESNGTQFTSFQLDVNQIGTLYHRWSLPGFLGDSAANEAQKTQESLCRSLQRG